MVGRGRGHIPSCAKCSGWIHIHRESLMTQCVVHVNGIYGQHCMTSGMFLGGYNLQEGPQGSKKCSAPFISALREH